MNITENKHVIIALWVILAFGAAFAGFVLYTTLAGGPTGAIVSTQLSDPPITTGTTGQGDVEIQLAPQAIQNGQLVFGFALNTHTVDLSRMDLRQAAVLEYNGKRVNALSGPQLGGHHINGQLVFPIDEMPRGYTVIIAGIPQQQQRVYRW